MLFHTYDIVPAETELYDIAVLAGGDSSEREISVASGKAVARALEEFGHQVATFDPEDADLFGINWNEFDACFIALHGGAGEDGRIQVQLEELGVPYTGSGPVTSRVAISKSATKDRLLRCGVSTPRGFSFCSTDSLPNILARVEQLGFPLIVKPDGQGCSLGVTVADDSDSLPESIKAAGQLESYLLAEQSILGREFTVAIIDRVPLPALEIIHECRMFDYDVKYGTTPVRYDFPDDGAAALAQETAVAAADALGTRGLIRVDLIMDRDDQAWVLEINAIPGMTQRSLAPLAAEQAGLGMPQFCDRLVRLCLPQAVVA